MGTHQQFSHYFNYELMAAAEAPKSVFHIFDYHFQNWNCIKQYLTYDIV